MNKKNELDHVFGHIAYLCKFRKNKKVIKENLKICIFTQLLLERFLYAYPELYKIYGHKYFLLPRIYNYINKI